MQDIEKKLHSFFEQAAQKDKSLLKILKQIKSFSVTHDCWCFKLPDLFLFLQSQEDVFQQINYKQFRKLIFNSNINQIIKFHGAHITIKNNKHKVDKSNYTLTWDGIQ